MSDYGALPLHEQVASLLDFTARYRASNPRDRHELRERISAIRVGVARLEAENRELRMLADATCRRYHYGNSDTRGCHV